MTQLRDPLVRILLVVGTAILAALLGLNIWFATITRDANLADRTMRIENQLRYVSCLLLVEPDQRTPEAVASCQVNPEEGE